MVLIVPTASCRSRSIDRDDNLSEERSESEDNLCDLSERSNTLKEKLSLIQHPRVAICYLPNWRDHWPTPSSKVSQPTIVLSAANEVVADQLYELLTAHIIDLQ